MSTLSEPVRVFVLPVVIGILAALVGAFLNYMKDRSDRMRVNRETQVQMATDILSNVISAMETLHYHMEHNAWNVAWRKSLPDANCSDSALVALDAGKWEQYRAAMTAWQTQTITFETQLLSFFGETGREAMLFQEISTFFKESELKLYNIYYSAKASGEAGRVVYTAEDQKVSKQEFAVIFQQTKDRIMILSATMMSCIQKQHVGTLRGGQEMPITTDAKDR